MVTRFLPLFSPIRRAAWHFHTISARFSDNKSKAPEVSFLSCCSALAPIDIDGFADEEDQCTFEECKHGDMPYKLPKIPEKRCGVYQFEGIKLILPQRMLRPETFRYRVNERDCKQADDFRICQFDEVQPFPRWRTSLPEEAVTSDVNVKTTSDVHKKIDFVLDDGPEHQLEESETIVGRVMQDVQQNVFGFILVATEDKIEKQEEKSSTTVDDISARSGIPFLGNAGDTEDITMRFFQNYIKKPEKSSSSSIGSVSLSPDADADPLAKVSLNIIKKLEKDNSANLENAEVNTDKVRKEGLEEYREDTSNRVLLFFLKWLRLVTSK